MEMQISLMKIHRIKVKLTEP